MTRPRFDTALRAAARTLAHGAMPAGVDRRVRARIAAATALPVRRTRWWIAGGLATAAAIAAVVVGVGRGPRVDRGPGADQLAGFELVEASADLRAEPAPDGALAVLAGRATVRSDDARMTIATRTPARLRKQPAGVRVLAGVVDVSVARRKPGEPPASIAVSHGAIVVLGTRFRVEQHADGGQVWLDEGAITFVALDGQRRELRPGDSLRWPLSSGPAPRAVPAPGPGSPGVPPEAAVPAAPAHESMRPAPAPQPPSRRSSATVPVTAPAPATPAATPALALAPAPPIEVAAAPALDTAAAPVLRDVAELRARGRYREAAERIERWLDAPASRDATRELMSFELVSILTYQLADPVRACAAVDRHARAYPRSSHAAALERARADLGCRDQPR